MTNREYKKFIYWLNNYKNPKEKLSGIIYFYKQSAEKFTNLENILISLYYLKEINFNEKGVRFLTEKGERCNIPHNHVRKIYIHGYNNGEFAYIYPKNL